MISGDIGCALLHIICNCVDVILQIVSVDSKASGGRARPRETVKHVHVPGKGKKSQKGTKADK